MSFEIARCGMSQNMRVFWRISASLLKQPESVTFVFLGLLS